MTLLRGGSLVAAAITLGLSAGLFYTYSASVMLGLARSDDRTYVRAMQNINVAIINPWFMAHFIGALVFTALAAALHIPGTHRPCCRGSWRRSCSTWSRSSSPARSTSR